LPATHTFIHNGNERVGGRVGLGSWPHNDKLHQVEVVTWLSSKLQVHLHVSCSISNFGIQIHSGKY